MASKHTIDILKDSVKADYFTDAAVRAILPDAVGLRGKVFRLLASGDILRLKRGFYIFNEPQRKDALNVFGIANALYGPSYISLECALSHYGLIPEGVVDITSVNINRTKSFSTPIGNFTYRTICRSAFPHGVIQAGGAQLSIFDCVSRKGHYGQILP